MADYPTITKLSQVDVNTPADTEVANKLDDAIRQLKEFLNTYLANTLDDDGNLKLEVIQNGALADAIVTTEEIANLAVTAAKIASATITATQLADDAVTAAKLKDDASVSANRAVTANHIQDAAVTTDRIATDAVTTVKIANDAVDATKLKDDASVDANRAVTTNHIRDGAVTNVKVGDGELRGVKLNFNGGTDAAPKLVAGATSGGVEATIGGVLSASYAAGVLTFAFASGSSTSGGSAFYARVEEQAVAGTDAGGITAGDNTRGSWTEMSDPSDYIGVGGNTITVKRQGLYLVKISVPGYSCGSHRCYLRQTSATATNIAQGQIVSASPGNMVRSELWLLLEVTADNVQYEIRQQSELTVATNGKGLAINDTQTEVYSVVEFFQLQQTDTEA